MKRISLLILVVSGCLVSMGSAQVQNTILSRLRRDARGFRLLQKQTSSVKQSSQLPPFSNDVIPTQCPADAIEFGAAACGYVKVPLDRDDPSLGKIRIYFELYLHSDSGHGERDPSRHRRSRCNDNWDSRFLVISVWRESGYS
jgi:hypothetical protein